MSTLYGPTMEEITLMNFTCPEGSIYHDKMKYQNPCPPKMTCFPDSSGDLMCQCATVAVLEPSGYPACQEYSDVSPFAFALAGMNVMLWSGIFLYNVWMGVQLVKLKEFAWNPVTQALIFSALAGFAGTIQTGGELLVMILRDGDFHEMYYQGGTGIGSLCLVVIGSCIVLSDLSIPLLWFQIASSGMNKAEAAANKKRMTDLVNRTCVFFSITFFAVALVLGVPTAAMYSFLWIFLILGAFNIGSRKLRRTLDKGGPPTGPSINIRNYVRMINTSIFLYVIFAVSFIARPDENPASWWWSALLVYTSLGLCIASNTKYIRVSLEKKLKKMQLKKDGKVIPSELKSTVSSTSEATSEGQS